MKLFHRVAVAAAVSLLAVVPAARPAVAATAVSPVQIVQCSAKSPLPLSKTVNGLQISFVNHALRTADHIRFRVIYGAQIRSIIDAGTFTTGARIDHTLKGLNDLPYQGATPASCTVTFVHFINGSIWP